MKISRYVAIALWLAFIVIRTGMNGVLAIWDATIFGAFLLLVTLPTRSVRLQTLLSLFALGGFAMSVEAFVSRIILPTSNIDYPAIRAFVVPILENVAFLIPPAVLLWRRRDFLCSIGASDVMLMGAASASGFFLMEEAFIRAANEWNPGPIFFIPSISETGSRIFGEYMCVSHPVWGALAGMALGLALIARTKNKSLFFPIIAAGIGLGLFDHFTNNYGATRTLSGLRTVSSAIMLGGWIPTITFFATLIATLAVDLWINFRFLPPQFRLRSPISPDQHALAYEHFYAQNSTGDEKWRAELCAGVRVAHMAPKSEAGVNPT